ncbi:MAG: response regulator transcription factor [Alphaproteobacteria bacterium]|nr:response regulator transcription factor [Alphaproteobacteria bacterium]
MKVLLVEDDPRIVSFIERGLSVEGYSLSSVANGEAALREAQRASLYDVIILDLILPDMNGHDVCHELRQHRVRTPIIMLTALDGVDEIVRGLEMGADDYLTKPFDFDVLLARLRSLRRRSYDYQDLVSSSLRLGNVELDVGARRAYLDGGELHLTATEFRLFAALMHNADKVLTRNEILQLVWQTDQDPLTNIVDVYIRHLRRKIDSDLGTVAIETVRGHGYRLTAKSV